MRKPAIIENCYYAQGTVTAISGGGLVGKNDAIATVRKCYASGTVSVKGGSPGANSYLQGLVGNNVNATAIIKHSFFDINSITPSYANGSATTTYNGTGTMTEYMKRIATFTTDPAFGTANWDFDTVWGIAGGESGYPYLRGNLSPP